MNGYEFLNFQRNREYEGAGACYEEQRILWKDQERRTKLQWQAQCAAQYPNPNSYDSQGRTPLMQSILEGHDPSINYLLEAKADVNAVDKQGHSALSLAVDEKRSVHYSIVEQLIENKADINVPSAESVFKKIKFRFESIPNLLTYGIDVHFVTKSRQNALHLLCAYPAYYRQQQQNKINAIEALLLAGVDYGLKDTDDKTPLDCLVDPTEKEATDRFIAEKITEFRSKLFVIISGITEMRGMVSPLVTLIAEYLTIETVKFHKPKDAITTTTASSLVSQSMVARMPVASLPVSVSRAILKLNKQENKPGCCLIL